MSMYGGHALTTGNEKGGPQKNNELNHALVAIIHRCSHHRLHPIYKLINQGEKSVLPKLFKLMGIVVIVALVSTPVFAACGSQQVMICGIHVFRIQKQPLM
jgi:hypothetical protein